MLEGPNWADAHRDLLEKFQLEITTNSEHVLGTGIKVKNVYDI